MTIPWEGLKDMNYIYCYTNKINGHKYVGQTNNFKRRINEHKSCAYNKKAYSYNDLIHKKIRQYGIDNFDIEVLEIIYNDNQSLIDEREQYWIKELNSHCRTGQGYNMTEGGQGQSGIKDYSSEEITQAKQMIKNGIEYIEITNQLGMSASYISSINHGVYHFDEQEKYPLYKYYKEDKDYDELIELLINSNLSLAEIARQLGMGYSTVKKINSGTLRKGLYPTYPIRKVTRVDRIKNYLLNSDKSYAEIAQLTGASKETVRRTNLGITNKDDQLTYPLRNL